MTVFFVNNPIFIMAILTVLDLFMLVGTIFKPRYFWDNYRAKALRKVIGDRGTEIIYYIISFAMIYLTVRMAQTVYVK